MKKSVYWVLVVGALALLVGCATMQAAKQAEANKDIVMGSYERLWNQHNIDLAEEFYHPDYLSHDPHLPEFRGVEGFRQLAGLYMTAFPDLHFDVQEIISEGDIVASRYLFTGTHTGYMGDIPPTGKEVALPGLLIQRIADGKITEDWLGRDSLGSLQQLGLMAAAGDAMANKKIVLGAYDKVWNQHDLDAAAEFYHPDYVVYDPHTPEFRGVEGFREFAGAFMAAFPDNHMAVDAIISEGDLVISRYTFTGTHTGPLGDIPATGKHITVSGLVMQRIKDGKIAEDWPARDVLGMMLQLGFVLAPGDDE